MHKKKQLGRALQKTQAKRIEAIRLMRQNNAKSDDLAVKSHMLDEKNIKDELRPESTVHQSNIEEMFDRQDYGALLSFSTLDAPKQHSTESIKTEILSVVDSSIEQIPVRPSWASAVNDADQLRRMETEEFLRWRKHLHKFETSNKLPLTPYEKSLNVWRQFWHVVEESDLVCQIIDSRDPLLFYCPTIEKVMVKYFPHKKLLLLLNKADLLTTSQIEAWHNYFVGRRVKAVFWSATTTIELQRKPDLVDPVDGGKCDPSEDWAVEDKMNILNMKEDSEKPNDHYRSSSVTTPYRLMTNNSSSEDPKPKNQLDDDDDNTSHPNIGSDNSSNDSWEKFSSSDNESNENLPEVLGRAQLIELFQAYAAEKNSKSDKAKELYSIGMIGFPNVGKSSTVNQLMEFKRVAVSATPGKTKHFQTFLMKEGNLKIVDCPGLVFPTVVNSYAHMILAGVLPIDQIKDLAPAVDLLVSRLPQFAFEAVYSIKIPTTSEREHNDYCTREELLSSFSVMRGYMTAHGTPNLSRASKTILKDFIAGKLKFVQAPPGCDLSKAEFNDYERLRQLHESNSNKLYQEAMRSKVIKLSNMEDQSNKEERFRRHFIETSLPQMAQQPQIDFTDKHWRRKCKQKKQKLRRKYESAGRSPYE